MPLHTRPLATLAPLVRATGGELYDGGRRASIPGPGHSAADRSVSLLLVNGRIVVHSFGRSTWREVLDDLRRRGLLDERPRSPGLHAAAPARASSPPSDRARCALQLWDEAVPLGRSVALRHLRRRKIDRPSPVSPGLRYHPRVPSAIYAGRGRRRPALLAAIHSRAGELCGVEVTYLEPSGERAQDVPTSRKVIGATPASCAVRLDQAADELLVAEGVVTTLSASARFQLPGWALLSTRNLRTWCAPDAVRHVLVAADADVDGQRSAALLAERLAAAGRQVRIETPPPPFGDWNEAELRLRDGGV